MNAPIILTKLQRKLAIREHQAAIKELSEPISNQPTKMLSFNNRLKQKFAAAKQRNEAAAAEIAKTEAAKITAAKPSTSPSAIVKPTPAPAPTAPSATAPKPAPAIAKPSAPVAHTITAKEFVASTQTQGPRITRSEFNRLTDRQKKQLADAGGRIVPDPAPTKKAGSRIDPKLTGLAKAIAAHKAK